MENCRIDAEFKNLIPPLTEEEYTGLEQSLQQEGCRDAIVLWNDTIVDGHNRYEICKKYNIPFNTTQMEFDNRSEALTWIIRNQLARRNLPKYERARLALKLKPTVAESARKNQSLVGGATPKPLLEILPKAETNEKPIEPINTREIIANVAGISGRTLDKVEKLEQTADEALKHQLRTGEVSINQAYKNLRYAEKEKAREEKRKENAEKVKTLATPLEAQGLFQTIVIDPPWDYGDEHMFGRGVPDYSTMSIEQITDLPIEKIADENCHLYLWVTNKFIHEGFHLIDKWGFKFITCITWVKPSIGMGNYFRNDTEQVLFAVKGGQLTRRNDIGTHFEAPKGKHSVKPEEFYEIVESCSYAPYIDIFGRKHRDGWSVWGENG